MKYHLHKSPKLSSILKYKNPDLVERFSREYAVSKSTATLVFDDLKKFLWIMIWARKNRPDVEVGMFDTMLIIDEMWHMFLIFSKDYYDFCYHFYDTFIYHQPYPPGGLPSMADKIRADLNRDAVIEIIWKELGPDVAQRWFKTYGSYTLKKVRRLQLKAITTKT